MSALSYKREKKIELYNNLPPPPILLSNTTPSFHPSTLYHIAQPTEAHTPQVAVDPGSHPNTAGEESPPTNSPALGAQSHRTQHLSMSVLISQLRRIL